MCVTIIQRCGTGTGTGVDGEKLKFIVCLATIVQLFVQQPPTAAEASNICTDAAAAAYRRGDNVGPYVKVNQDHQNQYQSKASILCPIKFSWLYTVTTLCVKKPNLCYILLLFIWFWALTSVLCDEIGNMLLTSSL